jgi:hypothetical protein
VESSPPSCVLNHEKAFSPRLCRVQPFDSRHSLRPYILTHRKFLFHIQADASPFCSQGVAFRRGGMVARAPINGFVAYPRVVGPVRRLDTLDRGSTRATPATSDCRGRCLPLLLRPQFPLLPRQRPDAAYARNFAGRVDASGRAIQQLRRPLAQLNQSPCLTRLRLGSVRRESLASGTRYCSRAPVARTSLARPRSRGIPVSE